MNEIQLFLSHAIQLEQEAAERYQALQALMIEQGHHDAAAFFGTMAVFARKHLEEALERGGAYELPKLNPSAFRWIGGGSPEAPEFDEHSAYHDLQSALMMALQGEHRSHVFYSQVAQLSDDAELQRIAQEFADEEAQHVAELQHWLERKTVTS